jgi:hypothetical protein
MGKGIFIRLWDYEIRLDKDRNATVTEEKVRSMARKKGFIGEARY